MSNIAIKVEGLSKVYRLGVIGYGSLKDDLAVAWARFRGKDDPVAKIGEQSRFARHGEFWALKGLDFEVKQGDRVGVIGKNGAGKSTLLKILSRVTSPTSGYVKIKGRIASLLEVGTGFHPELTGRENVFLNGAILGMRRREIQSKFDEIVEFSGVEAFVDTPVKRYSSGMYVRLAFSVAAHLDSEILILDEVLSVGDAEFQKKCLVKMDAVSRESGKTVLFVSHNLPSLLQFCQSGLLLQDGQIIGSGPIADVAKKYKIDNVRGGAGKLQWRNPEPETPLSKVARVEGYEVVSDGGEEVFATLVAGSHYSIAIDLTVNEVRPNMSLFVALYFEGEVVYTADCFEQDGIAALVQKVGKKKVLVEIPTELLLDKEYDIEVSLVFHNQGWSLPPSSGQRLRFMNLTGRQHPLEYSQAHHPFTGTADPSFLKPRLKWRVEN